MQNIKDRNGVDRQVFPCRLREEDINVLRINLPKISMDIPLLNLIKANEDGVFSDEPIEATLTMLEYALDHKYTKDEIKEFADAEFVYEAMLVYLGMAKM